MDQAGCSLFVSYLFEGHRVYRKMRDSVHPMNFGGVKEDDQRDPLILCPTYPQPGFYLEGGYNMHVWVNENKTIVFIILIPATFWFNPL